MSDFGRVTFLIKLGQLSLIVTNFRSDLKHRCTLTIQLCPRSLKISSSLDLDECAVDLGRTDKLFCDVNAYCYNYADEGSYACLCMDGFEGNGKVGNCKAINNKGMI